MLSVGVLVWGWHGKACRRMAGVLVWDVAGGELMHVLMYHDQGVQASVLYLHASMRRPACMYTYTHGTHAFTYMRTHQAIIPSHPSRIAPVHSHQAGLRVQDIAFSCDDRYLASVGNYTDNALCVWQLATGQVVATAKLARVTHAVAWDASASSEFVTTGEVRSCASVCVYILQPQSQCVDSKCARACAHFVSTYCLCVAHTARAQRHSRTSLTTHTRMAYALRDV